jgi:N-acyl-D-aspartate/D-glutamate deacylase
MFGVVIRGGTVVDGSGAAAFTADVAVEDGQIVEVGRVRAPAHRVVDADGLLVTPGFVDPHTHYDGQATWDDRLLPSSAHGVTTVVLGNCGVGFAPVRPAEREWLVQLMDGVEDIPGSALIDGIRWEWESFPEYLDALERLPRAVDVAAQVPHGALRPYVMGPRGADDEPATSADIAAMAVLVEAAIRAGAVGVSTNRLPSHTARDGRPVPGTSAAEDELLALGHAMRRGGGGVLQVVSSEGLGLVPGGYREDVDWLARVSSATGLTATLSVTQNAVSPDLWSDVLAWIDEANSQGAHILAQCSARPLGLLLGWETRNPFEGLPEYEEVADLPFEARVAALSDPERRARILASHAPRQGLGGFVGRMAQQLFPLGDPPDYEPLPERSLAATASRTGHSVDAVMYDLFLERDGRQLVLFLLGGYAHHHADHIVTMLEHPNSFLGLADGGAHCSLICDASVYTSVLSYWTRDRTRGPVASLETAVSKMTSVPAALYGFNDRGIVRAGMRADLNVIDRDRLALRVPEVARDLPTGAPRVLQHADGYVMTMLAGVPVSEHDDDTGARPGGLIRRAGS